MLTSYLQSFGTIWGNHLSIINHHQHYLTMKWCPPIGSSIVTSDELSRLPDAESLLGVEGTHHRPRNPGFSTSCGLWLLTSKSLTAHGWGTIFASHVNFTKWSSKWMAGDNHVKQPTVVATKSQGRCQNCWCHRWLHGCCIPVDCG